MSRRKDLVEKTFPVPASKIFWRKLGVALCSPVTIVSYMSTAAVTMAVDLHPLAFAGSLALVSGGVFAYWKSRESELDRRLVEQLVGESNAEQDRVLTRRARKLLKHGFADYATTLASFVNRKRDIEKALYRSGELSEARKEVDNLVDAITFGVADQLEQLAGLDERLSFQSLTDLESESLTKAKREIYERVKRAFVVIEDTYTNLGVILNPKGAGKVDVSHSELDTAIEKLSEEHVIARKVRDRIAADWGQEFDQEETYYAGRTFGAEDDLSGLGDLEDPY